MPGDRDEQLKRQMGLSDSTDGEAIKHISGRLKTGALLIYLDLEVFPARNKAQPKITMPPTSIETDGMVGLSESLAKRISKVQKGGISGHLEFE
jgi:hypothetical protein